MKTLMRMKTRRGPFVLFLLVSPLVCFRSESGFCSGSSTTGANLLKQQVGSRGLAMGGAQTALTGDLSGILANPALLQPVAARSFQLMHWPGLAEARTEYASYSLPAGRFGIFAGTLLYRTLPDIANEEAFDPPVAVSDGLVALTLARKVGSRNASGGISLKLFNATLGDVRATSGCVDFGYLTQTKGAHPIRYGWSLTNLGLPVKPGETGEALPATLRGGASWTRTWFPNAFTATADASLNAEQNARVGAGVEWLQAGRLALRGGGAWSRYAGATFSAGLGWRMRSTLLGPEAEYQFDYAYLPFSLLDGFEPTHGFSMFVRF